MTLPLSHPTLALWAVAGAVLAWRCLPSVLGILGLARVQFWGEECPAAAEPQPGDAQFQLVAGQLRAAGLVPVGPGVERGWLFGRHWCVTYRKWFYATPERDCYVSLSRRVPDDPLRAAFMTPLSDGTMVV